MCILELGKLLMYQFHHDTLKISMVTTRDYYSQSLMYEMKLRMFMEILATIKEC